MADDEKKYQVPEIMDKESKDITTRERMEGPLASAYTPYSDIPFINKYNEWKINTYRNVIREEQALAGDLVDHQQALERLRDIDIEIQTDKARRRSELLEEKLRLSSLTRKAKLMEAGEDLEALEHKVKKAELEARLKKLQNSSGSDKMDAIKEELEEKIKRKELFNEYEIKKIQLKVKKELITPSAIEAVFNEVSNAIFQGKKTEEFTEKEQAEFKRMEILFNRLQAEH